MRRECIGALVPFKGMHRFIPALVKGAGYRLVEIPVNHRPRSAVLQFARLMGEKYVGTPMEKYFRLDE